MSTKVHWLRDESSRSPLLERAWSDAEERGWIPSGVQRAVVHVHDAAGGPHARDTARSLLAFLSIRHPGLRVCVIDRTARVEEYPDVERLDPAKLPRHRIDAPRLRSGALLPALWLEDFFLVTIVGVAPHARLGLDAVLAGQAMLLESPAALDLDLGFVAHRLMASDLSIACGAERFGDPHASAWWAIGPDDVAVDRSVAARAGIPGDGLPLVRHIARQETGATSGGETGDLRPSLAGYLIPGWRLALGRAAATLGTLSLQVREDANLSVQNLRRLPQFLQRRMPRLLGSGASS